METTTNGFDKSMSHGTVIAELSPLERELIRVLQTSSERQAKATYDGLKGLAGEFALLRTDIASSNQAHWRATYALMTLLVLGLLGMGGLNVAYQTGALGISVAQADEGAP